MKNHNDLIVNTIIKSIPQNIKPLSYLMDVLDMGRESAYRRLRGEIPFSLSETITICRDLNLSMDKIFDKDDPENVFFHLSFDKNEDISGIYANMLTTVNDMMEDFYKKDPSYKVTIALNRLPLQYFPHKTLFKFEYCRFLHARNSIPFNVSFSDISVPDPILKLHDRACHNLDIISSVTAIIDPLIVEKTIEEIIYFYKWNFLSKQDVALLHDDLTEFTNNIYQILRTGRNTKGNEWNFYASQLSIDNNVLYYSVNDKEILQIWIYFENSINIEDSCVVNKLHEVWLQARLKYATLASRSNDLLQSDIFAVLVKSNDRLKELVME